ncbi:MAG TPA: hypothetical protein DIU09_09745 [Hyphomonadaceae bacterium]|jgi:hypothetical protein|nr:hypothetical protein AEM38_12115 [Hyphomonadaceae bacterium UKL13-1]OYU53447.1 MAG: hypothetical protein CFE27_00800 [Alphaproteobacteria bacterium PA1]HCP64856.1 hypothetical protein [Hyphomonadaceae bacterium]
MKEILMSKLLLVRSIAAVCVLATPSIAQNGPAQSLLTTLGPGQSRSVDISLRARIGPLELARGSFKVSLTQDSYSGEATYRTSGIAASFNNDAGVATVKGAIDDGQLKPRTFVNQETNGKKRRITMNFAGRSVDVTAAPMWGSMGFPPATLAQKLEAVDPVTGLMELSLVTGRDAGRACGGAVKIFDGKRRYDIRTQYVGIENVSTPAYKGPATYCRGTYTEVAGFNQKKQGESRDPIRLEIWLADVGKMGVSVPVRMTGSKGIYTAVLYADRAVVR